MKNAICYSSSRVILGMANWIVNDAGEIEETVLFQKFICMVTNFIVRIKDLTPITTLYGGLPICTVLLEQAKEI